jgi:hypothetical protein
MAHRDDTRWVRNLRGTGRGSFAGATTSTPFGRPRSPTTRSLGVIEAYLARWGYYVKGYFKALPNPADHPVFSIERV